MINNFEAATNTYAILDAKSKETNGDYGKVEDVMAMYTPEYIKKRINKWIDKYIRNKKEQNSFSVDFGW